MLYIMDLILFLQTSILVGGGARIIYCLVVMAMNTEEEKTYRVRIRNVVIFIIISEVILELTVVVRTYFVV